MQLWLLRGRYEAPGWGPLERDARSDRVDVVVFDRGGWALLRAADPPAQYEGLAPVAAPDGLYLDDQGRSVYVAGGRTVAGAREVLAALGPEARDLLEKLGDPDAVLERLGRVY